MTMILLPRAARMLLLCAALLACAAPVTGPVSAPDAGRSPSSARDTVGDPPARAIELAPLRVSVQGDPRLGDAGAVIGIVEFNDFQCPYCRQFHQKQFAQLRKAYIDTGVVQFIHKDLPLRSHAQALPAAMAAHCAGAQGRFWEMHDALFAQQGRLGHGLYPQLAIRMHLNVAAFSACLDARAPGEGIARDLQAARLLGIGGTPSFLIGRIEGDMFTVVRQSSGAPRFEDFVREIEKLRSPAAAPSP